MRDEDFLLIGGSLAISFIQEIFLCKMVGLGGLEPPTSPLSGVRSNQAELQTRKFGIAILTVIR